jgi:hypothetical protein
LGAATVVGHSQILLWENGMNDSDKMKVEETAIRATVARAFEMSGCGYTKNQVTHFLDSLVNDGFYVCRSQESKVEQRADNTQSTAIAQIADAMDIFLDSEHSGVDFRLSYAEIKRQLRAL